MNQPAVVVGVDGSAGSRRAIRFAVREAARLDAPLLLVHVVPVFRSMAPVPMMVITPSDLIETGRTLLDRSLADARAAAPTLAVDGVLLQGRRAAHLADAAADGQLLVVGRDDRPAVERLLLGNTAAGVARRSTCPVVSVPPDWDPEPVRGVVVVGIKSTDHVEPLLTDAFAVAAARGARLVVLHAWKLPSGYDDVVSSHAAVTAWNEETTEELRGLLDPWRQATPDVHLEVRVEHAYAHVALQRASEEADLLLLLRRGHGVPAAAHLGGTARSILRTATCPVRIVPGRVPARAAAAGTL